MKISDVLFALQNAVDNEVYKVEFKKDIELKDGTHINKHITTNVQLGCEYGKRPAAIALKAAHDADPNYKPRASTPTVWVKPKYIKHCKNGNDVLICYLPIDKDGNYIKSEHTVTYYDSLGTTVPVSAIESVLPEHKQVTGDLFNVSVGDICNITKVGV